MDIRTLSAYDHHATAFADDWEEQPPASDLHALICKYFRPGCTADVGCGSGRDTAWLSSNGFPAIGFEPSQGLLTEARLRHPKVSFQAAALPELAGVADGSFVNVLCETVVMHLGAELIAPSVRKLLAIIKPGGTLYLSWRVTEGNDRRDEYGRLYGAFDPLLVRHALSDAVIILDEQVASTSSGKTIRRIIARKT
ncbi:class I SAM-dependent methyltransferase [Duganella sp. FT3S]|uniref:Class I SAM-dependent methyltransferase n=1 Tax=Rugamonas fusca TaxID=2758568 RepID=A0A7W2EIS4_9BURK|nr:class I SAM-dependent methyltransferase [Rugamonas fusca]MBA5606705.1 class I SAM-dependent methyltransferase [Rugamonas fusca]